MIYLLIWSWRTPQDQSIMIIQVTDAQGRKSKLQRRSTQIIQIHVIYFLLSISHAKVENFGKIRIQYITFCWENWGEKHRGDQTRMRTESNLYKGMTPPSTQNLKTLGLWVFFLIYYLTFSFLLDVWLRLTLGYLTISPSSETPSSTLIHSRSSRSIFKHKHLTHKWSLLVPPFTHLNETRLLDTLKRDTLAWNFLQEDFRYMD